MLNIPKCVSKNGVQNLGEQFSTFGWDAHHEAIYGKECEKIVELHSLGV